MSIIYFVLTLFSTPFLKFYAFQHVTKVQSLQTHLSQLSSPRLCLRYAPLDQDTRILHDTKKTAGFLFVNRLNPAGTDHDDVPHPAALVTLGLGAVLHHVSAPPAAVAGDVVV